MLFFKVFEEATKSVGRVVYPGIAVKIPFNFSLIMDHVHFIL